MNVRIDVSISKIFGLIKANISGDIAISHSGGGFVYNRLKKSIINALEDNKFAGTVDIDGETTRIER
jgi:hypothetical protein